MKKCLFCGEEIQDEATRCLHCDQYQTRALQKKKDINEPTDGNTPEKSFAGYDVGALILCPQCNKGVPASANYCPICGVELKLYCFIIKALGKQADAQVFLNSTRCPKCERMGDFFKNGKLACTYCGYQLSMPEVDLEIKRYRKTRTKVILILIATLILILSLFSAIASLFPAHSTANEESSTSSSSEGIVRNMPWDDSVPQVKSYLKQNLKDPRSFEAIQWSHVTKTADGNFQVACRYRAKNSFGGYVISCQLFTLDSEGNIIKVEEGDIINVRDSR